MKEKNHEVNYEKGGETKRKESFFIKDSELKSASYSNKPLFVLLYKETFLNINVLDSSLPSVVFSLLQEFKYVIPKDDPNGLPPEETKELQSQVEELISPCVLHVLLKPKKDGLWRMCIYFHVINNIMAKIRGRIFSRKGGMMRIKAQRICDASFYNIYWEFNLNYGKFRFGRLNDGSMAKEWSVDLFEIPLGPMTRARAKRFKEALHVLIREAHLEEVRVFNSKKGNKDGPRHQIKSGLGPRAKVFLTC